MKLKIIIAIVAAIIAIHGILLYLFMRGDSSVSSDTAKKSESSAVASTPLGTKPSDLVSTFTPPDQSRKSDPKSSVKPAVSAAGLKGAPTAEDHRNPNLGKPFSYAYAVDGNIASIPLSQSATSGILVDLDTRTVLWAKNPRKPFPIASMTKIMTALLAYEDVLEAKNGVTLDTMIPVTRTAMKIGGSQVWLDPKETFSVTDLLKAVSIKSANDAAYLIGEYFGGGDVNSFVSKMNAKAKAFNMKSTKFYNPHGLPGATSSQDNVSSPEDMAFLAEHTLEHRQLMEWAATNKTDFREPGTKGYISLENHNHLIVGGKNECPGVDGLKTGFINRSGFCITVTCKRNNRRMVVMVTGFPSAKERDTFVRKLLDWGYSRAENPSEALASDKNARPAGPGSTDKKAAAATASPAKKKQVPSKKKAIQ